MLMQPTPQVTCVDVDRIVRRDFDAYCIQEVFAVLTDYGLEDWHREACRVHLAVLKLAAGSVEQLRTEIETAKCDYRDVLAPAEYPGYCKFRPGELSADDEHKIIDADWKQYQQWLTR